MATALVTQIAYAVQTLFDPAGTAGRLVDLGKLANYGLLTSFTPAALYTTGVNGAWYDPSDFSTLFQDAAGTLPVTAVEQPVGLMLDKSKGLVLGPELVTNGTQWTAVAPTTSSWTPSTSTLRVTGGISGGTYYNYLATAGTIYKATFTVSVVSAGTWYVIAKAAVNAGGSNLYVASGTTSKKVTFYFTNTTATPSIYIQITNGGVIDISNISVRELPGNHAFNPSGNSANFPVLQQDGTGRYYIAFNGVNQWLQTNSIDFTYGDKMFVSAGVRKLSDGTASIMETSSDAGANLGSMLLYVNNDTINSKYRWLSRGTNIAATSGADNNPAPRTDVISGIGNISGDKAVLRINGTQAAINTADQGTGNYGNYPLYIGARAGTGLFFNGRLYGLVVAGKAASASEIANTETWLNQKTGAY